MLLAIFPAFKENKIIGLLNQFFRSKYYIILVGIMTFLCHMLAFEMIYYYSLIAICLLIPFFISEDLITVVAPLAMTYSSVSLKSNNTRYKTSLFGGDNQIHMFAFIAIIATVVLVRLVFDLIKKPERRAKPTLLLGYLFLGPCYVLGGFLSPYWQSDTILYGLVNFLTISGCYFLLLYLVDWKKAPKNYFAWVMTVYGLAVAFEVFYITYQIKSGNTDYISYWNQMFTGWGMRNNIAGQIALCVVSPIYLAYKSKKIPWLFLLFVPIMFAGILLTNSRGSLATASIVTLIGLILYFRFSSKKQRFAGIIAISSVIVAGAVYFAIKRDEIAEILNRFFGDSPSITDISSFLQGRDATWVHGINHFNENELFGVGFFQCTDYRFANFSTSFVPPRYHNIYIQFLASTGLFGLCAYLYHRYQTLMMTFKKPSLEKTFIYLSIAALILCSLLDNHFFNLGPGLNYCIALAFIEGLNKNEQSLTLDANA